MSNGCFYALVREVEREGHLFDNRSIRCHKCQHIIDSLSSLCARIKGESNE